jgi:ATP-binding cassette subfamily E protein 1
MTKTLGSFKLNVEEGTFNNSEIIVLLGENGTGKTTFVRLLSGDKKCQPDETSYEVFILLTLDSRTCYFL